MSAICVFNIYKVILSVSLTRYPPQPTSETLHPRAHRQWTWRRTPSWPARPAGGCSSSSGWQGQGRVREGAAGVDNVCTLLVSLPVLLGQVYAPHALLLRLVLPPLLPGSPSSPPYSPDRCRRIIISTILWALRHAGLASAPAKLHTDATPMAMHFIATPQPPSSSTYSCCSTAVDTGSFSSSHRPW